MSETTRARINPLLPRVGRRYEAIRVVSENRREQMVVARDNQRHDFVLLRRVALCQPQDSWPFQERAQRLLFISHPNLAGVRDYFLDHDERAVLVMEMQQGLTLEEYAGQIQSMLPPRLIVVELVNVIISAAQGLSALHQQSLIHGAITPHSIILSGRDGFPVLTQYALGVPPPLAATTTDIVRPPWIAPEVKPPHRLSEDPRTDVYALGATLYSILVGVAPRLNRGEETSLTPASKLNVHVDAELDQILAQMVARDPNKRVPQVSDLVLRLEAWKSAAVR